jgi:hypothetical protein
MANLRIVTAVRNTMLDAINTAMNAGAGPATAKIYTGTQPANANATLSGNTLLATLTFTDPAAPSAASGVLTFSAITSDTSADATGTATFARIQDSDGNTVFDCDVGTSGATLNLNTVSVVSGGTVAISSGTLTISAT